MYSKIWTVEKDGEHVPIVFVTKKDAVEWIAEKENPDKYTYYKETDK
jgi:hypothetical protein